VRPSPPPTGRSYLNAANGIFVGYDTLGEHLIRGCSLYRNRQSGILRGSLDPRRVVLERNHEFENRGLPPDMTGLLAAGRQRAARAPSMVAKDPVLAEEGGWGEEPEELRTMRSTLEELNSTMSQRQHQKYLKRC
jgi:hypothetical protein